MTATLEFLGSPDITRLGWTLVHFLWQGAVLGAAFAAVRSTLGKAPPNTRYLAGCLTLLLMAACVVGTFAALGPAERLNLPPAAAGAAAPTSTDVRQIETLAPFFALSSALGDGAAGAWQVVEAGLPWGVGLWAVGVVLFSLRLAGGWLKVRQSRRGSCVPPEDPLCERFSELRQRLGVSRSRAQAADAAAGIPWAGARRTVRLRDQTPGSGGLGGSGPGSTSQNHHRHPAGRTVASPAVERSRQGGAETGRVAEPVLSRPSRGQGGAGLADRHSNSGGSPVGQLAGWAPGQPKPASGAA